MKNYIDLFKIFAGLHGFLENNGIKLTKEDYPVFRPEFILQETPQEILPFSHRNACKEKSKTAVCFFENDKFLYRRIARLNQDLPVYKEYLGICGFDLSPRIGWSVESQKFNIALSQMATLYLALHGVKIIPNFRIGSLEKTISSLAVYPAGCPFVLGALGCYKRKITTDDLLYLKIKLLYARPSNIYIYGKLEQPVLEMIDDFDVPFRIFSDFKSVCFAN